MSASPRPDNRENHHEAKRQSALRDIERIGGRRWTITDVTPAAYGTGDPAESDPDFYARPRTWMYAPLFFVAVLVLLFVVLYNLVY